MKRFTYLLLGLVIALHLAASPSLAKPDKAKGKPQKGLMMEKAEDDIEDYQGKGKAKKKKDKPWKEQKKQGNLNESDDDLTEGLAKGNEKEKVLPGQAARGKGKKKGHENKAYGEERGDGDMKQDQRPQPADEEEPGFWGRLFGQEKKNKKNEELPQGSDNQ